MTSPHDPQSPNPQLGGAWGQPTPPQAPWGPAYGAPTGTQPLAGGDSPARGESSKKRILVGGIVGALLLSLIGVGAFAYGKLAGGGAQPETRVPASAVAYAEIDLDPSAAQKVATYSFLRKFPKLRENISGDDDTDFRRQLWDALAKDDADLRGVDYKTDIEPWLGERAAVAVLAGGDDVVQPLVVVQVTDDEQARAGVEKLRDAKPATSGELNAYVVADGFLFVAETQTLVERFEREGREKPLSEDGTFRQAFDDLGDPGVTSGYINLDRAKEALESASAAGRMGGLPGQDRSSLGLLKASLQGQVAWGLRFDGDDPELVATGRGLKPNTVAAEGAGGTGVGELPSSTVFAMGNANLGSAIRDSWASWMREMEKADRGAASQMADFERMSGLNLPEDFGVLFGERFVVAVDGESVNSDPKIAARITTDAGRFSGLVDKVLSATGAPDLESMGVTVHEFGDGVVVGRATQQEYLSRLAQKGDLGQTPGFRRALPEAENADVAIYVDLDTLGERFASSIEDPDDREALARLDGAGLTVVSETPGQFRMRLRVVTK